MSIASNNIFDLRMKLNERLPIIIATVEKTSKAYRAAIIANMDSLYIITCGGEARTAQAELKRVSAELEDIKKRIQIRKL